MAFITLALLTFFVSLAIAGMLLFRRPGWRLIGGVLVVQAILLLIAQVVLSTFPFGIGEPLIRVPFRDVTLGALMSIVAIGGVGGGSYACYRWLARSAGRIRAPRLIATLLLLLLPLVASAGMAGLVYATTPERERERDPAKRQITLAAGFSWSIYVQGTIDNPTTITFGPDGRLYIADIAGDLWVASDTDGDHVAETIQPWAEGFELLLGLAWKGDELFAASQGKIEALRDSDGDGRADQRRLVVGDLPAMIFKPHSNNGIAFGPDGRLYFGVGSTTDGQVEQEPLAASILSVNPDGSDLRVVARGLGNSFDVAFNHDGELFSGDNSPGGEEDLPDEFNHIVEGGHYGYPYFYGDPPKAAGTRGALTSFPPHSVPTGVTFYNGSVYPVEYQDNAFVALWGRGEIARIQVARTTAGTYLSQATTFGSGFLYPIDVVVGPDGALYVADFGTSAVYRITYDATKQ